MMANDPSISRLLPRPVKSLAATREDLRKRATTRLAERIDLTKSKFKPLSLLRQDARRILDQLLDQDAPTMGREDRDKFVDEILAQSQGFGPLEELFRDESVTEFMTMAFNQIISRKGESWLPTSVQFRDAEQYRQILVGFADHDPLRTSSTHPVTMRRCRPASASSRSCRLRSSNNRRSPCLREATRRQSPPNRRRARSRCRTRNPWRSPVGSVRSFSRKWPA